MNQLQVVPINGQLVTNSQEVSAMVGKPHYELLKDIRKYSAYLAEGNFHLGDFFIESSYKDSNNQSRPCFLITRKGCDMVANKMTGQKGVLFTTEYVTRFEEMEKQIRQPKNQLEILQVAVNELTSQDKRNTNLENTMRIDGGQEFHIRKKVNQIVIETLGGKNSPAYQQLSRKAYSEFWREFKNHYGLPRYGDLPKKNFEDALRFIGMWQPSTTLRIEIQNANNQQTIREVI
ncbi:Rha family transcriptional regulator [Ornithinibacillus xuwenensis]|uniref:ORF6C domain-containing protein n=1 Tax=Ornithinibacillus xuwenensis TaxID=3144668 RepID=A0ABU9XC12_9BACI